jgi:hypothetical protein
MKNLWITVLAAVAIIVLFQPKSAEARKPYKDQFEALYPQAANEPFKSAKCNICHMGESKKERNAYGQALAKLLKKGDEKDVPKITSSLEAVAKEPSDASNAGSPTFGDLIKSGKLPGG